MEEQKRNFTKLTELELTSQVEELFKLDPVKRGESINNYLSNLNLNFNFVKEVATSKRDTRDRLEAKTSYLTIILLAIIPILIINFDKVNSVPAIIFTLLGLIIISLLFCIFIVWPTPYPRISEYVIKLPSPTDDKKNLLSLLVFYRDNIEYYQRIDLILEQTIRPKSRANLFAYIFLIDFIINFFLYLLFSYYKLFNFLNYCMPVLIVVIPIAIFLLANNYKDQIILKLLSRR